MHSTTTTKCIVPRYHRKCHRRKGGIKLNNIQQDALSQVSSAGDDDDELDDNNDEPHTTTLDADETGMPDFEEKSNEPTRAGEVMQYWKQ